ncbi:MAG TPA: hypothetical protein VIV40_01235 [Kofleriaceae bacterium]
MHVGVAAVLLVVGCSGRSDRVYPLDDLPVRDWTLGLPVSGDGKLVVSRSLVDPRDWSTVTGHAVFTCNGCTLGDDHTAMKIDNPWADDPSTGVDFGHLTFDTVNARADFANGRMRLDAQWRSQDFELDATIDGVLAKTAGETTLDGCVRFRPTEALRVRDPKLYAVVSVTGASTDDDGWYNIKIGGTLGEMKSLGAVCRLR